MVAGKHIDALKTASRAKEEEIRREEAMLMRARDDREQCTSNTSTHDHAPHSVDRCSFAWVGRRTAEQDEACKEILIKAEHAKKADTERVWYSMSRAGGEASGSPLSLSAVCYGSRKKREEVSTIQHELAERKAKYEASIAEIKLQL